MNKGKLLGTSIVIASFILIGSTYVFSETLFNKNNKSELTASSQATVMSTNNRSQENNNHGKKDFELVDFKNIDGEELSRIFNNVTSDGITELLDTFHEDSDRIAVATDGTIVTGTIESLDENSNTKEVIDTEIHPKGLIVLELKNIIETHKDEINKFAK